MVTFLKEDSVWTYTPFGAIFYALGTGKFITIRAPAADVGSCLRKIFSDSGACTDDGLCLEIENALRGCGLLRDSGIPEALSEEPSSDDWQLVLAENIRAKLEKGYTARCEITSDSMMPVLRAGDTAEIRHGPAKLVRRGDIAAFMNGSGFLVHRISGIKNGGGGLNFIPRGDANNSDDPPISEKLLVGIVRPKGDAWRRRVAKASRNIKTAAVETALALAPLDAILKIPYRAAAQAVVRECRKLDAAAVYWTRSFGREDYDPGASDIDSVAIFEDGRSSEKLIRLGGRLRTLRRVFPMIGHVLCMSRSTFDLWCSLSTYNARELPTWRLAHGGDIRSPMPFEPEVLRLHLVSRLRLTHLRLARSAWDIALSRRGRRHASRDLKKHLLDLRLFLHHLRGFDPSKDAMTRKELRASFASGENSLGAFADPEIPRGAEFDARAFLSDVGRKVHEALSKLSENQSMPEVPRTLPGRDREGNSFCNLDGNGGVPVSPYTFGIYGAAEHGAWKLFVNSRDGTAATFAGECAVESALSNALYGLLGNPAVLRNGIIEGFEAAYFFRTGSVRDFPGIPDSFGPPGLRTLFRTARDRLSIMPDELIHPESFDEFFTLLADSYRLRHGTAR